MQIAASLAAGIFFQIASFLANINELFDRIGGQIIRAAEGFCKYRDLRRMFERFEPVERLPEIFSIGDRTVVRHKKCVVVFYERLHCLGQLIGRWRAVIGKRHAAKRQNNFGQDWFIDREPGNGKCRPVRRMRVADRFDIGAFLIYEKVHRQLGRSFLVRQRLAFHVRRGKAVFCHPAFARHRRRGEHCVLIEADADIAVRRNNVAPVVQQVADLTDEFSGLGLVHYLIDSKAIFDVANGRNGRAVHLFRLELNLFCRCDSLLREAMGQALDDLNISDLSARIKSDS